MSRLVSLIEHPAARGRWQAHAILLAAREYRSMSHAEFSRLLARQLGCPELTPAVLRAWEQRKAAPPNAAVQAALELLTTNNADSPSLCDAFIAQDTQPCPDPGNTASSNEGALVHADGLRGSLARALALSRADLAGQGVATEFSVHAGVSASRDWLVQQLADTHTHACLAAPTSLTAAFSAFQELDTQCGGGFARDALLRYLSDRVLHEVQSSIESRPDPAVCAAIAELLYLAGLTAFDTGLLGLAQRYQIQALRLAQEAGAPSFAANIMAAISHLANTAGHAQEAIHLATAGLTALRRHDVPAVRMRLELMQARGHALMGDCAACRSSLRSAEDSHARAVSAPTPRWACYLDIAFLTGEMALCFESLGDSNQVITAAEKSIEESQHRGRRRLISYAVLARTHAQAGNIDQAYAVGHQALDLYEGGIRSWRAQHGVLDFSRQMIALGERRESQGFHERLHDLHL